MDDATTEITIKQHKSNAPWILGLIAFSTSIPNILCATVCAAVGARVSAVVAAQNATTYAEAESAANASNEAMAGALVVFVIISLDCFILSFLGKSKISGVTGILLVLGAVFILINGFVGLGSMVWGSVTGTLYLISGIFSIINKKRVA